MNDSSSIPPDPENPVAAYKALLKDYLDQRPSGTRLRIAEALGTHKSFISQVANPAYRVPLPAQHIPTIMEICCFSPEERATFLAAYHAAHPDQPDCLNPARSTTSTHTLRIDIPPFETPGLQAQVEETICTMASLIIALARKKEAGKKDRS